MVGEGVLGCCSSQPWRWTCTAPWPCNRATCFIIPIPTSFPKIRNAKHLTKASGSGVCQLGSNEDGHVSSKQWPCQVAPCESSSTSKGKLSFPLCSQLFLGPWIIVVGFVGGAAWFLLVLVTCSFCDAKGLQLKRSLTTNYCGRPGPSITSCLTHDMCLASSSLAC